MSDQRLPAVHVPPRKEPEPEAPRNDRRTAREDAGQSGKGERKAISGIGIGKRKGPMLEHRAKSKTIKLTE